MAAYKAQLTIMKNTLKLFEDTHVVILLEISSIAIYLYFKRFDFNQYPVYFLYRI